MDYALRRGNDCSICVLRNAPQEEISLGEAGENERVTVVGNPTCESEHLVRFQVHLQRGRPSITVCHGDCKRDIVPWFKHRFICGRRYGQAHGRFHEHMNAGRGFCVRVIGDHRAEVVVASGQVRQRDAKRGGVCHGHQGILLDIKNLQTGKHSRRRNNSGSRQRQIHSLANDLSGASDHSALSDDSSFVLGGGVQRDRLSTASVGLGCPPILACTV